MPSGRQQESGPAGIELKPAHFPGRAPVDTYGNGGFRFADMSHRGSILCLPSGIYSWTAREPVDIDSASLKQIYAESGLEILLVGTGTDLCPLPQQLCRKCADLGIRIDPMSTGAAARTFNVLLSEGRAVGAALLAVD